MSPPLTGFADLGELSTLHASDREISQISFMDRVMSIAKRSSCAPSISGVGEGAGEFAADTLLPRLSPPDAAVMRKAAGHVAVSTEQQAAADLSTESEDDESEGAHEARDHASEAAFAAAAVTADQMLLEPAAASVAPATATAGGAATAGPPQLARRRGEGRGKGKPHLLHSLLGRCFSAPGDRWDGGAGVSVPSSSCGPEMGRDQDMTTTTCDDGGSLIFAGDVDDDTGTGATAAHSAAAPAAACTAASSPAAPEPSSPTAAPLQHAPS